VTANPRRVAVVAVLLGTSSANAGPPFVTDDPEPVDHEHWEVYLASQDAHTTEGWSGTAPHVEVNYGALTNLQLHVIVPLSYAVPSSGSHAYGIGDVEVGAKYRFLEETSWRPQLGTFPLVELPTGNSARGLGGGNIQVFLPLWLQKSFGRWSTYGGGGYWFHPGVGNRDWVFAGLEAQVKLSSWFALGGEVFHGSSMAVGMGAETRFNIGAMLDISDHHHLLGSAGSGLGGGSQGYFAYQLTFGS
jgi:hypothetical protein